MAAITTAMITITAVGMTVVTADGEDGPVAVMAAIRAAGMVVAVAEIPVAGMAVEATAAHGHLRAAAMAEAVDGAAVMAAEAVVTDSHRARLSTAETIRPAALSSGGPDFFRRRLTT